MSNRSLFTWTWLPRWSKPGLALLASDIVALFGTAFFVGFLREVVGGDVGLLLHAQLALFLLVAPAICVVKDLYSAMPPPAHEELRSLAIAVSLAYLCVAIYFFLGRVDDTPSRGIYLFSWLCSLATVPLLRSLTRRYCSKQSWGGVPTVVLGDPALAGKLVHTLRAKPRLGFRPMAYANWDPVTSQIQPHIPIDLAVLSGSQAIQRFVRRMRRKNTDVCAILNIPLNSSMDWRTEQVSLTTRHFPTVVLVPEEFAADGLSFWVRPLEIGHMLGLKIRQNLLDPKRLALKRCMDLLLSSVIAFCSLPILLAIGLAIRIESPGPALFRQKRIGQGGREIKILKFRTMVRDAEECLARYLDKNPQLRAEWEATQKLQNDPRITKVGDFLRRTSLDELPQIWNVLCGDMSLVGPRPIVREEIAKYGHIFDSYMRVRPGITGLWQVSGRSDLSYPERVRIDAWYISNWSTWLDLYILTKTIPVVFERKGAY